MTELLIRRLRTPEEFRGAEEVQRKAWGMREEHPVPASMQRALQDNGGLILGAFHDIHLVGFNLAFVGWDNQELFYWSHMNAVLPEYQNHQLGFRLKAAQRDEVMRLGLSKIRWTFDPLVSKNAHLSVRRLGARPDKYMHHYYGAMDTAQTEGIPTDRLRATWELGSDRVKERMAGNKPAPEDDTLRAQKGQALLSTEVGDSGLRVPKEVQEPGHDAREGFIEVPFDLGLIREHQPGDLKGWRLATREAFRAAIDSGWGVDDFAVVSLEHERRAFYFLSPRPPEAGPTSDAPAPG